VRINTGLVPGNKHQPFKESINEISDPPGPLVISFQFCPPSEDFKAICCSGVWIETIQKVSGFEKAILDKQQSSLTDWVKATFSIKEQKKRKEFFICLFHLYLVGIPGIPSNTQDSHS
jgi:hypothetical protein